MRKVVAFDNGYKRQRAQSPKIKLLAERLTVIAGERIYSSGEVLDADNAILGKRVGHQPLEVQPAVRGSLKRPVVEVEGVDVDERPHQPPPPFFARRK